MSSAEENGAAILEMINCTGIIETVTEKTSESYAASIQIYSDDVEFQQKQIMEQQNQIKDTTTMVTRVANLKKESVTDIFQNRSP